MTRKALFGNGILTVTMLAAALALNTPAYGQTDTPVTAGEAGADTATTAPVAADEDEKRREPGWDIVGGFEGDTNETGYGFFGPNYQHPLSNRMAVTGGLKVSYLFYEFANNLGGTTKVTSPGIAPQIGLKFYRGKTNFSVSVGLGYKDRKREISDEFGTLVDTIEEKDFDLGLGASLYTNPTRRTNIHAIVSHNASDGYTWSRLSTKYQLTNVRWRGPITTYLGPEVVWQGNEDIHSYQLGGMFELLFVRPQLSLQFRGGYKNSSYPNSPRAENQTGAYYGIGLYKKL